MSSNTSFIVKVAIILFIFNLSVGVANDVVDAWMPGQEGSIRPAAGVDTNVYTGSSDSRYDISNVGITGEETGIFQYYYRAIELFRSIFSTIEDLVRTGKRLEDIIQGVFPGENNIRLPNGIVFIIDGVSVLVMFFATIEILRGVNLG